MNKKRGDLKFLYMQIRDDDETREEEFLEFVRFSGLRAYQIDVLNLFDRPVFDSSIICGYDGLFVGGSSDVNISDDKDYEFTESASSLLMHCIEKSIPVFASCYGFHLMVEAMGGSVDAHEAFSEKEGSCAIGLTDVGREDVLMGDLPDEFRAVSIHKDSAVRLPEGVDLLASTATCPYEALKVSGKPFYAFQFHPEIDKADLISRIRRYQDRYTDGGDELQSIIDRTVDMSDINGLLWRFIDLVVLSE